MVTTRKSDAALARLLTLHPKLVDLSLGRMVRLLAALGNPERQLPPVVHVTGTNGKGSVLAFLRAMLEAAGQRVHVYTSPHLVHFHERIRLAGALIDEDLLDAVLGECEAANAGQEITFFEITTAAAFVAFARTPADIVLLENGLGGRLDATNVVAKPALTGITTVSMDHQQFLGDSLDKIAFEKAGIIKPGVACVLGPQKPEATAVIDRIAAERGAPVLAHGDGWTVQAGADGRMILSDGGTSMTLPAPNLIGPHQHTNAAMAAVMARRLGGFGLTEDAIRAGVQTAEWPARLQRLTRGPIVDAVPADWEVWLDGGHNPDAGEALARFIQGAWTDRPLYLIAGMIDSKQPLGYFRPLARFSAETLCVTIPDEKAAIPAAGLARVAGEAGHTAAPADSALAAAGQLAQRPGPARLMVCGSLYLAGRILAAHG